MDQHDCSCEQVGFPFLDCIATMYGHFCEEIFDVFSIGHTMEPKMSMLFIDSVHHVSRIKHRGALGLRRRTLWFLQQKLKHCWHCLAVSLGCFAIFLIKLWKL